MILRFLNWFVHKLGIKSLIGFLLLLLAVGSSAYAFSNAISQISFGLIFPVIFFSLLSSWLLAQSKMRGWVAAILLILFGLLITLIHVGALSDPLFALIRVFFSTLWQILNLIPGETVDLSNLSFAFGEVYSGVNAMVKALFEWFQSLRDGLPLINDVAITLLWNVVLWSGTAWAGWWLRRSGRPLVALLPIGILATAILGYTWSGTIILGPMLFATLLLFSYVNYDQSEETWKSVHLDYPEDLPKEFSATSLAVVFGIVVFALILPSIPFQGIIDYVSDFTSPQIKEAEPVIESFGLEQSSIPIGNIGSALQGGLPRLHLIGSSPDLSKKIVMTVKISGGGPSDDDTTLDLPLYWRSLTYNEYSGSGWRSSDIVIHTYDPGEKVILTDSPYHQMIQQEFRMAQGEPRFLYAAGDIVTADEVFKIAYRPTPRYTEIFKAHGDFFGASIDQNAYRVQSLIPMVSEEVLREVPDEYPAWVIERYLPLPDKVPSRISQLAEDLTAANGTTYDKVRTLESYLRGFEYTLDVDLPPVGSDLVDYFLFDLQKGYCDYFASAMAVMARSLGIPSRLAIGYVRGAYDRVNNRYIVSEAEAHSWVEVYFAEIGWIPFEPTSGREAITRFETEEQVQQSTKQGRGLDILTPWRVQLGLDRIWPLTLGALVIVFFLLGWGIFLFDHIRLQNMTPTAATNHLYQRLYRHGRGLGIHTLKESTPIEFSATLENRLATLSLGSLFEKPLQNAISQVRDFTRIYTLMRYSPLFLGMEDRKRLIHLWINLRRRLYLARLRQFTSRLCRPRDGILNQNHESRAGDQIKVDGAIDQDKTDKAVG